MDGRQFSLEGVCEIGGKFSVEANRVVKPGGVCHFQSDTFSWVFERLAQVGEFLEGNFPGRVVDAQDSAHRFRSFSGGTGKDHPESNLDAGRRNQEIALSGRFELLNQTETKCIHSIGKLRRISSSS
jgi:hypothetical protein